MKSKEKKKTTFMQIMSSPVLLLRNARDSYINSFNGCANDVGRGGAVVCPVPHVSHAPKNFSYGSSKSKDDEKLREMLRQATCKRIIGREVGLNLQRQTEVIEATTMRKSYSVGVGKIGRIDEDKPCSFEENLLYPRSKSHAIGNVLHRPLSFDYEKSKVNLPKFLLNPYSWTKVANIIFLDAPVGTGFSYANTWQGYIMNDTLSAAQNYYFLRKWLIAHPSFLANPLYIGGDSYSGIIVPMIVQHISDGIDAGHRPRMNLKGYFLGNPLTDSTENQNSVPHFAYLNALISHEIYESAKRNCKGEYVKVDPSNGLCIADLENIKECISRVNHAQIYEPSCRGPFISPRRKLFHWNSSILEEDSLDFLSSPTQPAASGTWCRFHNYVYSYIWANDKTVQRAIGVREGTVKYWVRCNQSLSYTKDVSSSLAYHRNLIKKGYQVLIYSGDVDMKVPYVATESWIKSLNLTIETGWQPWFVEGQVAGYWYRYKEKNNYHLTFATVKGAGHTAPEYKPKECLAMIDRWFACHPL